MASKIGDLDRWHRHCNRAKADAEYMLRTKESRWSHAIHDGACVMESLAWALMYAQGRKNVPHMIRDSWGTMHEWLACAQQWEAE